MCMAEIILRVLPIPPVVKGAINRYLLIYRSGDTGSAHGHDVQRLFVHEVEAKRNNGYERWK